MRAPLTALVALLCCSPTLTACPAAGDRDVEQLLEGVGAVALAGVPGNVCIFGGDAFAVLAGDSQGQREAVVGASLLGSGRVVAFGHDGYLAPGTLDQLDGWRLFENSLLWSARRTQGKLSVAVWRNGPLSAALGQRGYTTEALDDMARLQRAPRPDVVCIAPAGLSGDEIAQLTRYVRGGGGVVAGLTGWGWAQLNPLRELAADCPGNRFLAPAGMVWGASTLSATAEHGFAARGEDLELLQAQTALRALTSKDSMPGWSSARAQQAAHTLMRAARLLPPDERELRPKLQRLRQTPSAPAPTPDRPLLREQALERLLFLLELDELERTPVARVKAHAAAAAFPGSVPSAAPRVVRSVEVARGVRGWIGTGLYAAPGETIELSLPGSQTGQGWQVQIGAHSDDLTHLARWQRAPRVIRREKLATEITRVAWAFGGCVFLITPDAGTSEPVTLRIRGAVEAPRYVLGETSLEHWRTRARALPAPWAELCGRRVAITIPSEVVRGLEDPQALMEFWDRVLDACAELAQMPPERARPERFVADVQISAGYMHAGYPIMTHLDVAGLFTDLPKLASHEDGGCWGFFHELGHNHQSPDWTFEGAGEVTCNLFTLYALEQVCGVPVAAERRVSDEARALAWNAQRVAEDPVGRWNRDPFLALMLYVDVQQAFGWEPFQDIFRQYRNLPAAERPRGDALVRDQFLIRLSRAVGHNLGPFFAHWGVPTSDEARLLVHELPLWMPPDRE